MNPLAALIGSQIKLDYRGWRKLSWLWVAMFVCSAIANEIAWRNLSTDAWVTFKVFGLTGISLVFVMLPYRLSKNISSRSVGVIFAIVWGA